MRQPLFGMPFMFCQNRTNFYVYASSLNPFFWYVILISCKPYQLSHASTLTQPIIFWYAFLIFCKPYQLSREPALSQPIILGILFLFCQNRTNLHHSILPVWSWLLVRFSYLSHLIPKAPTQAWSVIQAAVALNNDMLPPSRTLKYKTYLRVAYQL